MTVTDEPGSAVQQTHTTDGDEFMLAAPGIEGHLVRRGPGHEARVTATAIGAISVARLELDFAASAEAVATGDSLILCTMLRTPEEGSWDGVPLARGQTFVYPIGSRHQAADPAGLDFVMTVLPMDLVADAATALGFDARPSSEKRVLDAGSLWRTARRMSERFTGQQGAVEEDEMVDSVVRAVCVPPRVDARARPRWHDADLVADATDLINQHPTWVVPMITLCRHVGVSDRRLQQAFHRQLGITPLAYMRHRALQAAHRCLRTAPPGSRRVSEIAREHGFAHLGRFASFHAAVYGELPSAVLRRR